MRVITTHELSRLTRAQLFALLVQLQAVLADMAEGSPEFQFTAETLANIRAVLARRAPSP
jgi:ABC-type transporter Mla subunit MlaD